MEERGEREAAEGSASTSGDKDWGKCSVEDGPAETDMASSCLTFESVKSAMTGFGGTAELAGSRDVDKAEDVSRSPSWCAVSCCGMACCAASCCAVPCCVSSCCAMPRCATSGLCTICAEGGCDKDTLGGAAAASGTAAEEEVNGARAAAAVVLADDSSTRRASREAAAESALPRPAVEEACTIPTEEEDA